METLIIATENDLKRWLREAMKEILEAVQSQKPLTDEQGEPLLNRKEIAGILRVSLVTLHHWIKEGLPRHKQKGRVYFIKSEVLEYVREYKKALIE